MSQPDPLNISLLQTFILRESENDVIQKLNPNFYESLSKFIGDLKKEEYDSVEEKIKNTLLNMITDVVSLLLKLRLEKAISTSSDQSMLLDEEKYILDSRKKMEERKDIILSGILSGKTNLLESTSKAQKPQDD